MKKVLILSLMIFQVFSNTFATLQADEKTNQTLYSELIPFYDVNSQYVKEALEKALKINAEGPETIILLNDATRDNPQGSGSSDGGKGIVVGAPVVDEGARGDFKRAGGEVLVNLLSLERVELAKNIIRKIDYPRDIVDIEFVLVSIDRELLSESGITLAALFEDFRVSPQEIAKNISTSSENPENALANSDISSATLGIGTLETAIQHTFHKLKTKISGNFTSRQLHNLATVIKTINLPVRDGLKGDYTLETQDIIVTQSAFGTGSVSVNGGITLSVRPMIDRIRGEHPEIVIDFLYSNGSVSNSSNSQESPRVTRLEHKQSLSVVPGEITPLSSLISTSNEKSKTGFDFFTFIPIGQKNFDTEARLDLLLLLRANIRKEKQINLPQFLLSHPQLREELLGQNIVNETYRAILNSELTISDILHRLQLVALNPKNKEMYQAPLLLEITETNSDLEDHVLKVNLCTHSTISAIFTVGIRTKSTCWEAKTTVKELATTGLPISYELSDNEHYYLFVKDGSHRNPVKDKALIKFVWHKRANILEQLNEPTRIQNEN